ncbi:hypothetical protein EVAR_6032_1 [Eumeta japonica]|uniref:Uncharacterized protein n=1 Tax=Eumeta variegata TaxID=151549 RepID=A0A4C1TD29_EUMVA|nr:hypothetical protein EVAR_6032_1 [Eumeta japonica]
MCVLIGACFLSARPYLGMCVPSLRFSKGSSAGLLQCEFAQNYQRAVQYAAHTAAEPVDPLSRELLQPTVTSFNKAAPTTRFRMTPISIRLG